MWMTRNVFILLALLLSNGCVVNTTDIVVIEEGPNPQLLALWQVHKAQAAAVVDWRIRGKLAVKASKKGGHASLRWNKAGIVEHLEVFGPLGGGRVEIDTDENGAILKDTQGKILRGLEMEPLLQQRLGWPLPFNKLSSWVRGLPASDTQAMQFNENGEISSMNDSGWQVSFPKYQSVSHSTVTGEAINMPQTIELNALPGTLKVYDDKGEYLGEDLFVRLIIKSWQ
ncbi:MAG: outer membrane lipoprotein LolB [Saprospiraceae bacterium]|jgi:outer membrane lipoprotein LolB